MPQTTLSVTSMRISRIQIQNFRNFTKLDVSLGTHVKGILDILKRGVSCLNGRQVAMLDL